MGLREGGEEGRVGEESLEVGDGVCCEGGWEPVVGWVRWGNGGVWLEVRWCGLILVGGRGGTR